MKRFRQYLIKRKFIVRTDHSALQWLRRTPEPIAQPGRWLAIMEEFDFSVQRRAGNKHLNADALSRRPSPSCGETEDIGNAAVNSAEQAAVRAAHRDSDNDPDYRPLSPLKLVIVRPSDGSGMYMHLPSLRSYNRMTLILDRLLSCVWNIFNNRRLQLNTSRHSSSHRSSRTRWTRYVQRQPVRLVQPLHLDVRVSW